MCLLIIKSTVMSRQSSWVANPQSLIPKFTRIAKGKFQRLSLLSIFLCNALSKTYKLSTNPDMTYYLGMHFIRDRKNKTTLSISQRRLIH